MFNTRQIQTKKGRLHLLKWIQSKPAQYKEQVMFLNKPEYRKTTDAKFAMQSILKQLQKNSLRPL